jgi:hypothetical protein
MILLELYDGEVIPAMIGAGVASSGFVGCATPLATRDHGEIIRHHFGYRAVLRNLKAA